MAVLSRNGSSSSLLCFGRHRNSNNSEGNMRIADVLSDSGGEGEEIDAGKRKRGDLGSSPSFSSSARSLISRWLSKSHSFSSLKRKKKKEDEDADPDADADADPCVVDPPETSGEVAAPDPPSELEARGSSELSVNSGRKHEDLSFNVGMGVGMVLLLAKSVAEFNKMVEMRADMELLLNEIRHEVRVKDAIASSSESVSNLSFSPSRCCRDIDRSKTSSTPNCSSCFALEDAWCDFESERESNYATAFANTRSLSMNQMAAELEFELERLHHNLVGEGSSVHQHRTELDFEDIDPSFESFSIDGEEEIIAPKDDHHDYSQGVCARELERKLHELLATRQRDRIAELESALACAEKKLHDKEMELKWWKETQCIAAQSRAFI